MSFSSYYNSDYFLEQDYCMYQQRISEAEWEEKEAMCDCGSWRDTDIDGSVIDMDCKVCDEKEHQEWIKEEAQSLM